MRLLLALALLALAGCGDDAALKVSAASSLKTALPAHEPGARYSFAGSDELAAQIRAGARPDVFAAANTELPRRLFADELVERPVVFASNRLVIAIPRGARKVRAVLDLSKPGVRLAIGAPSVPVGSYTREVLARLGRGRSKAMLANVGSNEPEVAGIVGKLTQGAVDAGIVYVTDVEAAGDELDAIELPDRLQPKVRYAAAVVRGARDPQAARDYVEGLRGARDLREAGFGAP